LDGQRRVSLRGQSADLLGGDTCREKRGEDAGLGEHGEVLKLLLDSD
jgi:hypothetical protein